MAQAAAVLAGVLAAATTALLLAPSDAVRLRSVLGHRSAPDSPTSLPRDARRDPVAASSSGGPATAAAGRPSGRSGRSTAGRWSPARAACALAGLAVAVLLPLPVGAAAGLGLALAGPRLLGRLEPAAVRAEREQLLRDLPLALDLLAACLAGGAALPTAAAAVGEAVGGPTGQRLTAVGAALAVGAPAGEAWRGLAGPDPAARDGDPLGPAARALGRAADGGAPVAAAVARLATEARADERGRAEQAARRVGVLAVAPLGLCFLPAFVLIGVVPLVIALAGPLFATL